MYVSGKVIQFSTSHTFICIFLGKLSQLALMRPISQQSKGCNMIMAVESKYPLCINSMQTVFNVFFTASYFPLDVPLEFKAFLQSPFVSFPVAARWWRHTQPSHSLSSPSSNSFHFVTHLSKANQKWSVIFPRQAVTEWLSDWITNMCVICLGCGKKENIAKWKRGINSAP